MEIVSSQSHTDIERAETAEDLKRATRTLAANMLRVVRGAGRSVMFMEQMSDVLLACEEYRRTHGFWPDDALWKSMLDPERAQREARPWSKRDHEPTSDSARAEYARREAIGSIRRGALQMTASMLADQLTQIGMGETELYQGHRDLGDAMDQANRTRTPSLAKIGVTLRRERAAQKAAATKKRKPLPKPKPVAD